MIQFELYMRDINNLAILLPRSEIINRFRKKNVSNYKAFYNIN